MLCIIDVENREKKEIVDYVVKRIKVVRFINFLLIKKVYRFGKNRDIFS